jgi:Condensation domain
MQQFFTRPLGTTEQALYLHDCANPLHFALTAQVKGEIQPDLLNLALTHLQYRHPLLRVRIAVDRTRYDFVEQSNPIPQRIVSRQGVDDWERELEAELRQPFTQTDAPLIRVVCLHSLDISELIIICHHAIADGLSAVNLVRDLLTILGTPEPSLPFLPMPTPLEALLPNYQPQLPHFWQKLILKVGLWVKTLTATPAFSNRKNYCSCYLMCSIFVSDRRQQSPKINPQMLLTN